MTLPTYLKQQRKRHLDELKQLLAIPSVSTDPQRSGDVKRAGKRNLQLNFSLINKNRHGLSIYHDGKRVPVTYTVLSKKGSRLAWGKMNYG